MNRKLKNILWVIIGILFLGTGIYAHTGQKMSFEEAQQKKEAREKTKVNGLKQQAMTKEQWKSMSAEEQYKYRMGQFQKEAAKEADSNLDRLIKGMKNNTLHPIVTGDHPIPSLGTAKDKRAVPYLIEVLQTYPEIEVRLKAAEALGNIGEKAAYADLEKALKDADIQVQLEAAIALYKLGYVDDSFPILEKIAKKQDADNWSIDVTRYIMYANYSETEKDKKRQELIKEYKKSVLPSKAVRYLGEIKNEQALNTVEMSLDDSDAFVRLRAGSVLMETERKEVAIPVLENIIINKSISKSVRSAALSAIARGKGETEKNIIQKYIDSDDEYIARKARRVLRRMESNE